MKHTNFSLIARPTAYEVARGLANRDDAIKPYVPVAIPKMVYPKVKARNWGPTATFIFLKAVLTP